MRIFALETNTAALKATFLNPGETEVTTVFYSVFRFFFGILEQVFITIALVILYLLIVWQNQAPIPAMLLILSLIWLIVVPYPIFTKFLRWRFSFLVVLTNQIVVVDQVSLFKREISQLNLEEFASVTDETQFFGLFPFGILHLAMKGGGIDHLRLPYVPHPEKVSDEIADTVSWFQSK